MKRSGWTDDAGGDVAGAIARHARWVSRQEQTSKHTLLVRGVHCAAGTSRGPMATLDQSGGDIAQPYTLKAKNSNSQRRTHALSAHRNEGAAHNARTQRFTRTPRPGMKEQVCESDSSAIVQTSW
jgi:hypothetical protein